jgi:hypothetical protein
VRVETHLEPVCLQNFEWDMFIVRSLSSVLAHDCLCLTRLIAVSRNVVACPFGLGHTCTTITTWPTHLHQNISKHVPRISTILLGFSSHQLCGIYLSECMCNLLDIFRHRVHSEPVWICLATVLFWCMFYIFKLCVEIILEPVWLQIYLKRIYCLVDIKFIGLWLSWLRYTARA